MAERLEAAVDASLLPCECTQLDWSQVYMLVTSGGYYCRNVSIFDVGHIGSHRYPCRHRRHLPAIICRKRSWPRDPELFSECRSLRSPRACAARAHRIDGLMVLSIACNSPFPMMLTHLPNFCGNPALARAWYATPIDMQVRLPMEPLSLLARVQGGSIIPQK